MTEPQIILLNPKIIQDFISKNLHGTPKECIYNTILKIIPILNGYEEEGQKINFKLAIGMNTDTTNLDGRFHILQEYHCNDSVDQCAQTQKIVNMINKVAIFCSEDADIFIIQNDDNIKCGVYFTDLEKTGSSEKSLLEKNFVIFEGLAKSKIRMIGNNTTIVLCLDYDKNYSAESNISEYSNAMTCRTWKGIFEKVKKTVHGTICLIVNSEWTPEKDDNFTSQINKININLSRDDKMTADGLQDFNNKLSLFLSMLNYDGITIIDTKENIRAYNVFCKINNDCENITGGARHRAYDCLKNLSFEKRPNYVALYFQSQEGSVKFLKFNKESFEESQFFDPTIMNGGTDNPFYKKVEGFLDNSSKTDLEINNYNDLSKYNQIKCYITNLSEAHEGIDNFYTEPKPAQELHSLLLDSNYLEIIQHYPFIIKELMNTVFQCVIGNSYGYSIKAQESLRNIIDLIDKDLWKYYFSNYYYIDRKLLWSLSNESQFNRWNKILEEISQKYNGLAELDNVRQYDKKDFQLMHKALVDISNSITILY